MVNLETININNHVYGLGPNQRQTELVEMHRGCIYMSYKTNQSNWQARIRIDDEESGILYLSSITYPYIYSYFLSSEIDLIKIVTSNFQSTGGFANANGLFSFYLSKNNTFIFYGVNNSNSWQKQIKFNFENEKLNIIFSELPFYGWADADNNPDVYYSFIIECYKYV